MGAATRPDGLRPRGGGGGSGSVTRTGPNQQCLLPALLPTAAPMREGASRSCERPRLAQELPPVLANTERMMPLRNLPARPRVKRKTILSRIEGWWDLGLLEKRQTLFGGGAVHVSQTLKARG